MPFCYDAPSQMQKGWHWQLSLLESLTRSRNALLLQLGDVEKNHDPVATTNADTQSKKSKFLTVIYMNTRSLIWHFDDFTSLASAEQPHIIAISETWLDSSVTNNEIDLAGYSFSGLFVIILLVVLLCIVVIIFHAPCLVAVLFPLVSNPCGFLWELAASIRFLPSAASIIHLVHYPSLYTMSVTISNPWFWITSTFLPVVTVTLTCPISTNHCHKPSITSLYHILSPNQYPHPQDMVLHLQPS